jgi:hypothetical protein
MPSIEIRPPILAVRGNNRMSERNVTVLPEPDSPRRHRASPAARVKLTSFTTDTSRSRDTKRTLRSSTSTSGPSLSALVMT